MTTFPESLPSDYGMFTTNGNAAAGSFIRKELAAIEMFFSEHDAAIVTTAIANRLEALGHDEAWDTVVRELIFATLTGERNAELGLAS